MIEITNDVVVLDYPGTISSTPRYFMWEAMRSYSLNEIRGSVTVAPLGDNIEISWFVYKKDTNTISPLTFGSVSLPGLPVGILAIPIGQTEGKYTSIGYVFEVGDILIGDIEIVGSDFPGTNLVVQLLLQRI